jgi:hypothetical protein
MLIAVSSFGEDLRRELPLTAPAEVVFKQTARIAPRSFDFQCASDLGGFHRENHCKYGSLSHFRIDPDSAAMIVHNRVHNGKP